MKPRPANPALAEVKQNPVYGIISAAGKILWSSCDPLNDHGTNKLEATQVNSDPEDIIAKMSQCVFKKEIVSFTTKAWDCPPAPRVPIDWQVVFYPLGLAEAAIMSVNVRLPRNLAPIDDSERQLLSHLCDDCTLKEAAERMFLSESAIDGKIKKLKQKLNVHNIGGLVAAAMRYSLVA